MKPVIALVGRPNVGKSTLFNRLTRSRAALVADFPGLTRDRHYGDGQVGPRDYIVIDTGGFEPLNAEGIAREMAAQAEQAIAESDVIIFVLDAREGVTAQDRRIGERLRMTGRPVLLAVNKAEGTAARSDRGVSRTWTWANRMRSRPRTAKGVRDLMDLALASLWSRQRSETVDDWRLPAMTNGVSAWPSSAGRTSASRR